MTAPDKEPLLFSRVTYGAMILAAIGSLTAIPFGMRYPIVKALSDFLFVWMIIFAGAILARLIERSLANSQIKGAMQQD